MDKVKRHGARSYGQFCGLARALDLVGERWNLLIVRELLPGPLRYNELKASLAGIASNLLAERLRTLEENGIVERRLGDAGVLYALTLWGAELREPMEALGRWGTPLVVSGRGGDAFHPRWLVLALPALLRGVSATPAVEVDLLIEGYSITLLIDERGPHALHRPDLAAGTVVEADPEIIVALAAGALTVEQARRSLRIHGDARVLDSVFPARRSAGMPKISLET
ncbi:helix-turn-helix domain-containing protein [Microbacterium sp. W4I20]|uniref:winged helix-turn-helix transcriptional regulator n=1 Tax=Microbacterium sp. W4I20 TaxID=3042262 RepID=UPI00277DB6C2|nr:helix-turn-helix domain-containing protein [Microbacterium sp. W4I20]MDQ0729163.1 DNA-binding HxlR family transcriptional regulator [Microbacterium sp. W4I20]